MINAAKCALSLIFAMLVVLRPAGAEEVAYVTDILQLGIHRAQDTSDRAFRNLVSGTELTVLERVPNYAKVRTPDGEEGWVRSAYLVAEKPAQLRLAELTAELDTVREALAAAEAAQIEAETSTSRLNAELSEKIAAADGIQDEFAQLQSENEMLESLVARYRGALPVPWVIGALVVVFAGGFLTGWWWLDRSIRRRFGGHRIY
jgi:SH3 domain protein